MAFSLRDQLAHSFGLQLDLRGGKVKGSEQSNSQPGIVIDTEVRHQLEALKLTFVRLL